MVFVRCPLPWSSLDTPPRQLAIHLLAFSLTTPNSVFESSGYLITTLLVQERTRTGSVSLRAFYRRRCYRILPAACAYLLIVTVFFWHIIPGNVLVCAWLYCTNFVPHGTWLTGHLWSLAVEEQFYLLWPLLLILFWNQRKGIAMAAFCAAPFFRAWYFTEG